MSPSLAPSRPLPHRSDSVSFLRSYGHHCAPSEDGPPSIFPEALEPIRCQLGVSHGVHDVLVAEVVLQGTRVPAVIGKLEPTRMPEHVRVDGELEPGADSKAGQHLAEARGGHNARPRRQRGHS